VASPNVISIHSFRRGTGKSTIAANLAALLALAGRRAGIADMDIVAPSMHSRFGLRQAGGDCTVSDYLLGRCSADEVAHDVTSRLRTDGPGRLWVMPSGDSPSQVASLIRRPYDVEQINAGFERLAAALALDCLIIDTRPGLDEDSLQTFAMSDTLAVVLRPDRRDFQGTAVVLDLARRLAVPDVTLVVNQVPAAYSLADVRAQTAETYQCSVAAVLPYVAELGAAAGGELFALSQRQHPLAQALRQLAVELMPAPA
jgi:septum site-determining protein MinD